MRVDQRDVPAVDLDGYGDRRALHDLLQDVTYPGLSHIPMDFVELPSQVNESWLMTPEVLDRFAPTAIFLVNVPFAVVPIVLAVRLVPRHPPRHLLPLDARVGIVDRAEIEWFDGPHTINGKGTFRFLHKHLRWPER